MKRAILIAAWVLPSFVLGWVSVCFRVQRSADERIAHEKAGHARDVAQIRQRIYGPNYFHCKGVSPNDDARLEQFNPFGGKGAVSMSYVGGLGGSDSRLQIQADGSVLLTDHGASRKVCVLDQNQCTEFFKRVMKSGILNYSQDVIDLKLDLTRPDTSSGIRDAPMTEFVISVPELQISKEFSICSPKYELKHHPDIIEFQLVAALEDEILGFIPKDDAFWK